MNTEEYNQLYKKYISGDCTSQERKKLENFQDSLNLEEQPWDDMRMGDDEIIKSSIQSELTTSIQVHSKRRRIQLRSLFAVAALLLIFIVTGIYYKKLDTEPPMVKKDFPRFRNDILPGDNRAILTLDDGSKISLDDAKNGILANENNTEIKKIGTGQLEYSKGSQITQSIKYNTLSTPMGGQYQLTLPDQSKVWLNSASSIRFPTEFTASERVVELRGEAYFEISKNKQVPFIVRSINSMEVKVLGTHFNVMAYENEKSINTTLIEGSVQIISSTQKVVLKPGQAAILDKDKGNFAISPADLEQAIAWKNGYFMFNNENIESIMRKVARWYNADITYNGNLNNKDFVGTISRSKNISELLKMLELTGAVHFTIEGRRITVMP